MSRRGLSESENVRRKKSRSESETNGAQCEEAVTSSAAIGMEVTVRREGDGDIVARGIDRSDIGCTISITSLGSTSACWKVIWKITRTRHITDGQFPVTQKWASP